MDRQWLAKDNLSHVMHKDAAHLCIQTQSICSLFNSFYLAVKTSWRPSGWLTLAGAAATAV